MKLSVLKRLYRFTGQIFIVALLSLLLFELCFRIYVIDFYSHAFNVLNEESERTEVKQNLLVLGDSFSATQDGYVNQLRDSLEKFHVTNVSVPGTSIREQFLFGRYHLKRIKPEVLVFQFYVGNDLFGWNHPVNWSTISLKRNVYWQLSERLWSLSYFNHRLSTFKRKPSQNSLMHAPSSEVFATHAYTERDKLYLKAEPGLIENAAYLRQSCEADLEDYLQRIESLFEFAGPDTQIRVLLIPHQAQVHIEYQRNMEALGAVFSDTFRSEAITYPLSERFESYFAKDKRVRVYNPLTYFSDMERAGQSLYYANDSHLNELGQKQLGLYLVNRIRQEGLTFKMNSHASPFAIKQ